jgi:hypothetical protein
MLGSAAMRIRVYPIQSLCYPIMKNGYALKTLATRWNK